ncbi:MAG: hypothetical protein NC177_04790 [Ruminococcus flavefaciens]|nr:hypothetical protein [Ruminococcus flavefaciens]
MENIFLNFLKKIDGISFIKPNDDELLKFKEISSDRLPDIITEVYTTAMPDGEFEFSDFVFYGINRLYDENINYVAGANIFPFGFFTFASTFDGDSICIDLNDDNLPVYQCSHELLGDETEIYDYDKDKSLDFNYDNIIKVSDKLAGSFTEFINDLLHDI